MKRGAPDHPKMLRLARELHVPLYAAVGLMEMLWHWARVYAPQGDPGRWGAGEVAKGCAWGADPNRLVEAMVTAGWLDRAPPPHNFVIHDIQHHADNSWKQYLEDQGLTWWDGSLPRSGKAGRPRKESPETGELENGNLQINSRKSPVPLLSLSGATPLPEPEPLSSSNGTRVEADPDEFQRVTLQIWNEHPAVARGKLQLCRQYASEALSGSVNPVAALHAAETNHKKWILIYPTWSNAHALKKWWLNGHWNEDPGEPRIAAQPQRRETATDRVERQIREGKDDRAH